MTEQRQYIITEEQVKRIKKFLIKGQFLPEVCENEANKLRSRPTLTVQTATIQEPHKLPDNYWSCPFRKRCKDVLWCSWPCVKWASWHDTVIRNKAQFYQMRDLQDWREDEMQKIPFDPIVFINNENKHISKMVESLRLEVKE